VAIQKVPVNERQQKCWQLFYVLGKVKREAVPMSDQASRHEDVWENGGINPRILNLGTVWR
jgi:hypothetical protein